MKIHVSNPVYQFEDYVNKNLSELGSCCYDGEANHIILENVISQIGYEELPAKIHEIWKKLAVNGKLTIVSLEIDTVLKMYMSGIFTMHQLNHIIFNKESVRSVYSIIDVLNIIKQMPFSILTKSISETGYFVIEVVKQ